MALSWGVFIFFKRVILFQMNSIRRLLIVFNVVIVFFAISNHSLAQSTVIVTNAAAVILTPIAVSQVSPLHFGVMAVLETMPGTVVLSTDGVRIATDGVNLSSQTPFPTNAVYNVLGNASTNYYITLPNSITVTEAIEGATMTINDLRSHPVSSGSDGFMGKLNGNGVDSFTVGATLTVPAAQPAGLYTGTFEVTIAYN